VLGVLLLSACGGGAAPASTTASASSLAVSSSSGVQNGSSAQWMSVGAPSRAAARMRRSELSSALGSALVQRNLPGFALGALPSAASLVLALVA